MVYENSWHQCDSENDIYFLNLRTSDNSYYDINVYLFTTWNCLQHLTIDNIILFLFNYDMKLFVPFDNWISPILSYISWFVSSTCICDSELFSGFWTECSYVNFVLKIFEYEFSIIIIANSHYLNHMFLIHIR